MAARAYVLVHCDVGKAQSVKEALKGIPGIQQVDIVTGDYDLIIQIEQPSVEELGRLIMEKIHGTPGVNATSTHVVVG